jgi:hypothetical protein
MQASRGESAAADDLRGRLLEVIDRGSNANLPEDELDALARDVFSYQFAWNPLYRAYCERRGATPGTVRRWLDIPSVPTDAFKAVPLVCGDAANAAVVFRTSGTTGGSARRGSHYLLDTGLYSAALLEGFRTQLLPDRPSMRILSLVPDPGQAPDSSLSFMIGEVMAAFGAEGSGYFVSTSGPLTGNLVAALRAAESDGVAVLLAGTSFAFMHLLDSLRETETAFRLAPSSRVMDTGGFKGRSREVGRDDLYSLIGEGLGIGAEYIVNEYGMTEMSSQLYDGAAGSAPPLGAPRIHRGPPWTRTVAVDPETLAPVHPGSSGILRHLDLANLYSVAALQTADLGVIAADGGVELLGRAPGAEARGCSIAMDELLDLIDRR